MFQLRQPTGQRLVGLEQLRHLCRHRGDLHVLSSKPARLRTDERDQLIARHLLRGGHPKIKLHPPATAIIDTPTQSPPVTAAEQHTPHQG
jgi:hypothetical protein